MNVMRVYRLSQVLQNLQLKIKIAILIKNVLQKNIIHQLIT